MKTRELYAMESEVVVITGASAGIGAAVAELLGGKGHRLVLAARRENELRAVARKIGATAIAVIADVTHRDEVEHIKDVAIDKFGQIDVWINNAGRGINRKVLDLSDDDVDLMLDVNLKSALYGMQVVVPYFMQQKKGHLINISSFLAKVPYVSFRSVYSASKAALNSLTSNLRMDLMKDYPEIHVSTVMPGPVLTEFQKNALGADPSKPPSITSARVKPQTAEEVAAAIESVIVNPRAELFTNPASPEITKKYIEDIEGAEKFAVLGQKPA
jgi:NADP-dependent 3-hydroxy acid dehydrogenase YdfG